MTSKAVTRQYERPSFADVSSRYVLWPSLLMYRSSGLGNSPLNVFHSSSPLAGVQHRVCLASELTCQHLFFFLNIFVYFIARQQCSKYKFFFLFAKKKCYKKWTCPLEIYEHLKDAVLTCGFLMKT